MILQIWQSFRSLPLWVQIWVALILVPVNMASLFFLTEAKGVLIAVLAIGGMLPNLFIMMAERGFSKTMALPHLAIWTPLVIIIALWMKNGGPDAQFFPLYLWVLMVVNVISLIFDYKDAWEWWRGARDVARP